MSFDPSDIVGIECKHVVYVENRHNSNDDLVYIKEQIHLKGDRVVPNVRKIENMERTFYVTKKGRRNHEQKKMFEKIDAVDSFKTTQRKLVKSVTAALGQRGFAPNLKVLARSPYLYGTDVSIEALVKKSYMDRWPNALSQNTVAVLDIETDMILGTEEIYTSAITFKDRCFVAVSERFYEHGNTVEAVQKAFRFYLDEYVKDRNITLEVVSVPRGVDAAVECIKKAHEWKPDLLAIWNINFDIPKILKEFEKFDVNPLDVFPDQSLPDAYKYCYYKEGPAKKITASGVKKSLAPAERWHTLYTPAPFYVIDAMCVYKIIRTAKGLEPSYALDAILSKELGIRKLKFKQADHLTSQADWHRFMQSNYKIEYVVYNLFDCISVEMLQEKVLDLSITVGMLLKQNDYAMFPSQPRRTCNSLHFFALEKGYVIASTSDQMETDLDGLVTSTQGWMKSTCFLHYVRSPLSEQSLSEKTSN